MDSFWHACVAITVAYVPYVILYGRCAGAPKQLPVDSFSRSF